MFDTLTGPLEITVLFGPVEPLCLVKVWKPLNNYLGQKGDRKPEYSSFWLKFVENT